MSNQQERTYSKRQVLGGVGTALTATAGVSTWNGVEGMLDGEEEATDMPLAHATPDGAQPNGGPMNQSYRDTSESATGVKNKTKVTDQPTSYAPITNPEGIIASVQYFDGEDDGYMTFSDIENQEVINQLEVEAGPNMGMWHDGNFMYGTPQSTKEITTNGGVVQEISKGNEGAIAKLGDTAYINRGYGIAESPINDISDVTKQEFIGNMYADALTVIEEGNIIAGFSYRNLVSHNTEKQETIAEPSIPADHHVSTDGENLFALDRSGFVAYDIPKSEGEAFNEIASVSFDGGGVYSPPVVSERDDETLLVTGTGLFPGPEGYKVQAYSFDGGTMNKIWSQEVEGSGNDEGVEQIVGAGDSVIVGAENLYGFNMNTGEKLFEEDIDGKPGMPHGTYVPVATEDGTYVLEMETGELSGQKPPQDPPEEPPSEPPQNGTDPGNGNNTDSNPPQEPPMNQTDPGDGNNTDSNPPEEPPMNQTDPGSGNNTDPSNPPEEPPMNQTDPRNGNTTGPNDGTGQSNISNGSASSDGSGPGFGLFTGLAGVAGGAAYAGKRYLEQEDSDEE